MPLKMNFARKKGQHRGIISIWIQAFRLHFVLTSIFPALLGSIIAWSRFREFNFWYFSLVIVGVTVHHIGLNMIDDVFDYLHAVDRLPGEEKNPYTGGSGVLTEGLLPTGRVLSASIFCYLIGIMKTVYLTTMIGWPFLISTMMGFMASWASFVFKSEVALSKEMSPFGKR